MIKEEFLNKVGIFQDSDGVDVCYIQDVIKHFGKNIPLDDLYQKSWDYQDRTGSIESITSVFDARLLILLGELGETFKDVEYTECHECFVCGDILLPDDECYQDVDTSVTLCDTHSMFVVEKDGYKLVY